MCRRWIILIHRMQKKKVCIFMRKPITGRNFSTENFYYNLFKNFKHKKIEIKFKICPLVSKGILNRIYLCIWAFFNQGNINHICGDINFISIFMSKKKTVNTFLDFYSMQRLKSLKKLIYKIFWIKIPFLKSESVITISNNTLRELNNYIDIKGKKKIHVIGISVSNNFKKKLKKKISKTPKILVVGTSINKNISNIITSLKNIYCELILVGQLNDQIINELNLNNIKYRNLVSIKMKKLIYEYYNSDILLFPSNYEGFGVPILEAQTIGRPVITSNLEPMISIAGEGAFFVNPKKPKEISEAIKTIIKNEKLRLSKINKGFINVKRYKNSIILNEHLKVYKEVSEYS